MPAIRKSQDIHPQAFNKCHDGEGILFCRSLLDGQGSKSILFIHSDDLPAGVSIGQHDHPSNEEVYYLLSGKGQLTYDDICYEMHAGDISLCTPGHSHGYSATEDSVLMVIGIRP